MGYQRKEFIAYKNISARHKKNGTRADMYYKVNGLEGHAKVKIRLKDMVLITMKTHLNRLCELI